MPSGYGYLPIGETFEDPRVAKATAKRDNRKPAPDPGYAARFADATERSLNMSPHWRAGFPLQDHTQSCDCPGLWGCVQRWPRGATFTGGAAGRAMLATRVVGR